MIVAITGTPGTGKTSVSRKLSEITGLGLISLNELAEKKKLHKGYDDERCCKIVDLKGIVREIERIRSSGENVLIEAHYAHEMPADLVMVLRDNGGVQDRIHR
jgi:adenylate kinase